MVTACTDRGGIGSTLPGQAGNPRTAPHTKSPTRNCRCPGRTLGDGACCISGLQSLPPSSS
uniref:Uncharacterized protein n=1 Tax=Anopheles christyi TaxID=43041 RepID=A0A182KHP0_9DIPT